VYHYSKNLVELLGIFIVAILAANSVAYLRGVELGELKLTLLIKDNTLAYMYIGIFIVYGLGMCVDIGKSIYKGIKKARDKKLDNQSKISSFLKWFFS
jgi:uncharacterized metal-binding protein